ncbi:1-deoxy-D-xylulose-5-phosphate synthase [uncultured Desulfobulbus sp.]|uniref:1-deoxy-D-xylulose-5-phosphate synthase n=1 Tax=uncultured Desulfobulbus sp. TaxID=239745 RepID=UPI00374D5324
MAILETINQPSDLKRLSKEQLVQLTDEIRECIIAQVSKTGGHLASNLGVVELTTALYKVYDPSEDAIIWDVGHQCYAHKLLTGRFNQFCTLRQFGGISGFPKRAESNFDCFGTGHSSTSISAALGFAKARDLKESNEHVVAIIGDGALSGGMAFEALNNAGQLGTDITVILNDNEMSISKNVGALSTHLSKLRMQPLYRRVENKAKTVIENLPMGGKTLSRTAEGILHGVTHLIGAKTGIVFEEMGFTYLGPIDGHDIELLSVIFASAKDIKGPILIHVLTTKGKGYEHAENKPRMFHGTPPFEVTNGTFEKKSDGISFTDAFAGTLIEIAEQDEQIVAITAAMSDGTGLSKFAEKFPNRFFDVGIAEQHAVTFAAGLAAAGMKPVIGIYSTFLQRAYDQVVHDVCLQNLPVVIAIDRAGLVGDDGPTHHGVFDLSFLRHIPNLVVAAPSTASELSKMLRLAFNHNGPFAIRYPRGAEPNGLPQIEESEPVVGKGKLLAEGDDVCIAAIGSAVSIAFRAIKLLQENGISAALIDCGYVKPLDNDLIISQAAKCGKLLLVEENSLQGGFGSAVLEMLSDAGLSDISTKLIGVPDRFIQHGAQPMVRELCGISDDQIAQTVIDKWFKDGR